jgi:hypothetical protein
MSVTVDQMRPKLYTLEQVQRVLARTEPMRPRTFSVGDPYLHFRAEPGWQHGVKAKDGNEPVGVYAVLGNPAGTSNGVITASEYQMTRSTLEETCLAFGFKRDYTRSCPAELLVPHMNYWFREGLLDQPKRNRDFQYLVNGDTAVAFTRQSLTPFSNLSLLEQAVAGIEAKFGTGVEILADYKFSHTLRQTYLRLIIPSADTIIADSGTRGDIWSRGVAVKNSLTGTSQTAIEGYLFRWVCTNGQIDTQASSGVWTRRKGATEAEVYEWARQAVDEALSGLDGAFIRFGDLTQIGIEGSLADTIRDVFEHHKIPIHQRPKIIRYLEEYDGEITMYVIMNAITQVANETGLEPATVDSLLRVGGDFARSADQRCGACHRMLHSH